jgi:hypothetical protein
MRTRTAYVLACLTVLACAAVISGGRPLMIVGGLPLALLLPGTALSALLFRQPRRLIPIERIMLIPLLSLATLVLGGMLAWVAGAPLHRVTWLVLTAGVTLAALAAVMVRELRTPRVPAPRSEDDATPDGPSEPEPMDRRRRLLHQVVPAALAVLLLAGATWLSLASSIRSHHVAVTTLSVVPPGAADSSGERSVLVSATGLAAGDAYRLVVTTAKGTGGTSVTVSADHSGLWTSTLRLPGDDRLTLGLYRTGETAALRTVIIAIG